MTSGTSPLLTPPPSGGGAFTIKKGDIGFLYNCDTKVLHGIFEATTDAQMNIDKKAFNGRFPLQVRVRYIKKCSPVPKSQLETIDFLNFRTFKRDKSKDFIVPVELSKDQANRIIGLFESDEIEKETKAPFNPRKELGDIRTDDGHWVRSRGEAMIDSWLYNHDILHAYEKRIPFIEEKIFADFYIPNGDFYIEYWGMNSNEYLKKKSGKKGFTKNTISKSLISTMMI
jgi:hypothetical protein